MLAHDTMKVLAAAAALVNTDGGGAEEQLPDVAALGDFVRCWGLDAPDYCTEGDLRAVRDLRSKLRQLWQVGDEDRVVEIINSLLNTANAVLHLVRYDECTYHLRAAPSDEGLASRVSVAAAMAVADLVYERELSRLRVCASANCDGVVVDLSKNRSRKYCEERCGNRTAVAAYRARKAARTAADDWRP
jgi:predicted RNA-binding Zn ribbon-like protein